MKARARASAADAAVDGLGALNGDAWRVIFEEAPTALLAIGESGTISACNKAAAALFGRMSEGVIGLSADALVQRQLGRALIAALRPELTADADAGGASERIRTRAMRAGGVEFPAEIGLRRLRASDGRPLVLAAVRDLSEEEAAIREVAAAAEWSKLVEEFGQEPVIVNQDGIVLHVNRAAADLLGYERHELVGRSVLQLTAPESLATAQRDLNRSIPHPYEMVALTKDGRRIPVEVRRVRTRLHGRAANIASFHDMSREIERRAVLRASEERYRLLFERSMDGIFFTSPDGSIFDANPAACRMLGMSREEICRSGRQGLMDPSDPRWEDALRTRTESGTVIGQVRMRRKDGTSLTVDLTSSLFVDESGSTRGGVIIRDATARIEAEARVRAALRAEHDARRQVDAMSAAKSEFLATLSHEFRTGLTSIGWLMRPVTSEPTSVEERVSLATRIDDEVQRLLRLVDDVLDLDRMESGAVALRKRPVDLAELLGSQAAAARAGGRRVILRLEPDLPPVDGDPDRLRQVFANLIANATKFSSPGTPIAVGARHHGQEVRAWVRNRGGLIPADRLEAIFERFVRLEGRETEPPPGAGLGLAIVRELVTLHGGRVWATSTRSRGTALHVSLPAAPARARAAEAR